MFCKFIQQTPKQNPYKWCKEILRNPKKSKLFPNVFCLVKISVFYDLSHTFCLYTVIHILLRPYTVHCLYILCKIARSCNAVTQCDTGSQSEVSILYPNKEYKSSKSYKRNPIEYFITQPSCVYTVENTEIPSNSWMEKLSSKRQKYHRKRDGKIYKKKVSSFS